MFLAGHPNHQLVFMRIWQINPGYLTTAFREFYDDNNLNITRILDVAQDLKVSQIVSDSKEVIRTFTSSCRFLRLFWRFSHLHLPLMLLL